MLKGHVCKPEKVPPSHSVKAMSKWNHDKPKKGGTETHTQFVKIVKTRVFTENNLYNTP